MAAKPENNASATVGVKRQREWEATVSEKIYLPVGEDPDFDWVGLILGPNGKTQEEIESETRYNRSITSTRVYRFLCIRVQYH